MRGNWNAKRSKSNGLLLFCLILLRCGARGGEEVRVDPAKLTVHADERPPILLGRSLYLAAERHGRDLVIARAPGPLRRFTPPVV